MKRISLPLYLSLGLLVSCGGGVSSTYQPSKEDSSLDPIEDSSLALSSSESAISSPSLSSSKEATKLNPVLEPLFGRQYYLNHIGDIFSAWKSYRGKGKTIAVIDTGFDPYHEDFVYEDGSSKVSPLSAAFTKDSSSPNVGLEAVKDLSNSHGTFCAGVAAAGVNGIGVTGVAPEAELLLLRTDATPTAIVKAFDYARQEKVTAISISIGSYADYGGDLIDDGSDMIGDFTKAVKACRDAGIPVISAAGNGGLEGKPTEYTVPGATEGVIGVGGLAANRSDEIWSGSSYNSAPQWQFADVFAPAEGMAGCCNYDGKKYDGGWKGTSFAAPIVAGMAALYFEAFPNKGVTDFERDLFASCHKLTSSVIATSDQLGYGAVDVGALLKVESPKEVTVKLDAPSSPWNLFCWNASRANAEWPGVKMEKSGTKYVAKVDVSTYPWLILNGPSGQTMDLLASSFLGGVTLDLNIPVTENNCLLGRFKV